MLKYLRNTLVWWFLLKTSICYFKKDLYIFLYRTVAIWEKKNPEYMSDHSPARVFKPLLLNMSENTCDTYEYPVFRTISIIVIRRLFRVKFMWCCPQSLSEGRKRCVKTFPWRVPGKGLISGGCFHVFMTASYLENLGRSLKGNHMLYALFIVHIEQCMCSPSSGNTFLRFNAKFFLSFTLFRWNGKKSIIEMDDSRGSTQLEQFDDSINGKCFTIQP